MWRSGLAVFAPHPKAPEFHCDEWYEEEDLGQPVYQRRVGKKSKHPKDDRQEGRAPPGRGPQYGSGHRGREGMDRKFVGHDCGFGAAVEVHVR